MKIRSRLGFLLHWVLRVFAPLTLCLAVTAQPLIDGTIPVEFKHGSQGNISLKTAQPDSSQRVVYSTTSLSIATPSATTSPVGLVTSDDQAPETAHLIDTQILLDGKPTGVFLGYQRKVDDQLTQSVDESLQADPTKPPVLWGTASLKGEFLFQLNARTEISNKNQLRARNPSDSTFVYQVNLVGLALFQPTSRVMNIQEGDQSNGTPANLTDINTQLAADRTTDGFTGTYTLTRGSDLFNVSNSNGAPVLALKTGKDIDYETNRAITVRICAPVPVAGGGTTQECYQLILNVQNRDEAPEKVKDFATENTIYLTAQDPLPRFRLTDHFSDPERGSITGALIGNAAQTSPNGYTVTATITGGVLISFTKAIPAGTTLSGTNIHRYSFGFTATDAAGNTSNTLTLNIRMKLNANNPPRFTGGATSVTWHIPENRAGAFLRADGSPQNLTATDLDEPQGDTITYSIEGQDASGKRLVGNACVSINSSTGSVTVGCDGKTFDFERDKSPRFTIVARDRFGGSASVAVVVSVTDVPEPPQARNFDTIPPFNMFVGTVRTLDLTNHFFDPEGTNLTFTAISQSANATATLAGTTLTIRAISAGTARINIIATDAGNLSNTHILNVRIKTTGTNQSPTFDNTVTGFRYTIREDLSSQTNLGNPHPASDPDGDTLFYEVLGQAARIGVTQTNGQLYVRPGAKFDHETENTVTFILRVTDNFGGFAVVNITIVVENVNEPPAKLRDIPAQSIAAGSTIRLTISSYFTDPDSVDRNNLLYDVKIADDSVATARITLTEVILTGVKEGQTTVTIGAVDSGNRRVESSFEVTVIRNEPPTVQNPIAHQVLLPNVPKILDLSNVFVDDQALTFNEPTVADRTIVLATLYGDNKTQIILIGRRAGTTKVTVSATDATGATATHEFTVQVNSNPKVVKPIADQVVNEGKSKTIDLTSVFLDEDVGDTLVYTATAANVSVVKLQVNNAQLTIMGTTPGLTTVTVSAIDQLGGSVTDEFTVRVNSAPMVKNLINSITLSNTGATYIVNLGEIFEDADEGDTLTYTAESSSPSVASVSISGQTLTLLALRAGAGMVVVTAADQYEASVSTRFNFHINATPELVKPLEDLLLINQSANASIDLDDHFNDGDSEFLIYSVSATPANIVRVVTRANILLISALQSGTARVTVTATDNHSTNVMASFNVRVNAVPMVVKDIGDQTLVNPAASVTIDLSTVFSDDDVVDTLSFVATSSNPNAATATISGTNLTVQGVAPGAGKVTVTATDPVGTMAATEFNFSVNAVPIREMDLDDVLLANTSASTMIDLAEHFSDPDKEVLTFTATATDSSLVQLTINGSTLTIQAVKNGSTEVAVQATDMLGETATGSFMVRVNAVPMVVMEIEDVTLVNPDQSQVIDLAKVFKDDDPEDVLTYSATSSNPSAASVSITGSHLTVQGVAPGSGSVTVTSTDPIGTMVSTEFDFAVNAVPILKLGLADVLLANTSASTTLALDNHFNDPDSENLTYTVSAKDTSLFTLTVSESSLTIQGVTNGTTEVTVTATDSHGESISDTFMVRVNATPVVVMEISDKTLMNPAASEVVDLTTIFADADEEDTLKYQATSSNPSAATATILGSNLTLQGVAPGTGKVEVIATDPIGEAASTSFNFLVNAVPELVMPFDDVLLVDPTASLDLDLATFFVDPDKTALSFEASSSDTSIVTVMLTHATLTLQAVKPGNATISLQATDIHGAMVSGSFAVRVNAVPRVATALADTTVTVGTPVTVNLSSTFSDADQGDTLTLSAESSDTSLATLAINASTQVLTITGVAPGSLDGTITATDDHGASVADTFAITVKTVPMVATTLPAVTLEVGGQPNVSNISTGFADADGDTLTYSVSLSTNDIASASLTGSMLTLTAIQRGMTEATVAVADPDGNSTSQTFTVTVNHEQLADQANRTLAAFGRTMLGSFSDAIGSRVVSAPGPDEVPVPVPVPTEVPVPTPTTEPSSLFTNPGYGSSLNHDLFNLNRDRRHLAYGSNSSYNPNLGFGFPQAFNLRLGANGNEIGIWGAADLTNYEGVDYDGSASFFHVGADIQTNSPWLFGLALSLGNSSNEFSYGTAERDMDISVTTIAPYARYMPTDETAVWVGAGIGTGEVEISGGTATNSSDLSSNMFLLGARHHLNDFGYMNLAIRGEAGFAALSTDGENVLSADLDASVNRVRAVLEANFPTGGGLEPFVDLGVRNDGGDGDTGSGIELAGGVLVQSGPLNMEARAHILVSHGADDYKESGIGVIARYDATSRSGTGFSAHFSPRYGAQYSNSGLIWNLNERTHTPHRPFEDKISKLAFSSRLQYGIAIANDRYLLTPFINYDDRSSDRYSVLVGTEIATLIRNTSTLKLEAAVGQSQTLRGGSDQLVGFSANLRFH